MSRNFAIILLFVSQLTFSFKSYALVGQPASDRGVVGLDISTNGFEMYCTGSVISLTPPTVLTAAHCVRDKKNKFNPNQFVAKIVGYDEKSTWVDNLDWSDTELGKNYISQEKSWFNKPKVRIPDSHYSVDVALIKFSVDHPYFSKMTREEVFIVDVKGEYISYLDEIEFCGYGYDTVIREKGINGKLNCGSNSAFLSDTLKGVDDGSVEVAKIKKQFEKNDFDLKHFEGLLVFQQRYETHLLTFNNTKRTAAMLNTGDSGGPWFLRVKGQKIIEGITASSFASPKTGNSIYSAAATLVSYKPVQEFLLKNGIR